MNSKVKAALGIIAGGLAAAIIFQGSLTQLGQSGPLVDNFLRGLDGTFTFGYSFMLGEWLFPFVIGAAIVAFVMWVVANGKRQKERMALTAQDTHQALMP